MKWRNLPACLALIITSSAAAPTSVNNDDSDLQSITNTFPRFSNSTSPFPIRNNTFPIFNGKKETSHTYIVILHHDEQRLWPEIFIQLGFNVDPVESKTKFAIRAIINSTHHVEDEDHGHGTYKVHNGPTITTFGTSIRMFTMDMPESHAQAIEKHDNIVAVSKDTPMYGGLYSIDDHDGPTPSIHTTTTESVMLPVDIKSNGLGKRQSGQRPMGSFRKQNGAPWNLARISQPNRINNRAGMNGLNYYYTYEPPAGKGVDVYMLDTGINVRRRDFQGRAQMIFSSFGPNVMYDNHGHGTHTSGTVGSATYGVAKGVKLYGLKVLDAKNSGQTNDLIAGLERALTSHNRRKSQSDFVGSVISMSVGNYPNNNALYNVLQRITNSGMHVSISAMNDHRDACAVYPGAYERTLPIFNVGATDINDERASFSNYGRCITIHGPGVQILSTNANNNVGSRVMSGTSMACPAVSGLIAVELAKNPQLRLDPKGMRQHILKMSLAGKLRGTSGGDTLMYNGVSGE
ncbi:hypothetical protein TWF694_006059 [Orbilia ellipsospora]|uniref:Peptidase S8/S53 domain-containing protein n=1 Tax=Orbilia ellipsospora TaxID=2528407 RepID=A0AAV9WS56_9PEZI